ncbi:MAG TPA: SxtJ family membrane protein, partial [Terriglobales bacterium]|nr:SxtJ family membrane protein [Terriglobales bacterium]
LWPLVRGDAIRLWSLIVAGFFFGAAFFSPHIFSLPNRLWFRFGLLLGKILTPMIMGTLFLVAVLPVALVLRLLGKDTMRLRPDPSLQSYWLPKASSLTPETLKDQF